MLFFNFFCLCIIPITLSNCLVEIVQNCHIEIQHIFPHVFSTIISLPKMSTISPWSQILTNPHKPCSIFWSPNSQQKSLSCSPLHGTEAPCLFSSGCKMPIINTIHSLSSDVQSAEGGVPGYICNSNFYRQNISEAKKKVDIFKHSLLNVITLNHVSRCLELAQHGTTDKSCIYY